MSECEGPRRLKISWSGLQAHEHCRHKARLIREKKKSPAADIRPFFHGIVADRVMRAWLEADEQLPGQMPSMVEDMIEQCLNETKSRQSGLVRWKDSADRVNMTAWVKELVTRLEPFLLEKIVPFEYSPEYRFRVPVRIPDLVGNLTEIDLVGGMDILVRESPEGKGVWAGYDLKATENPSYLHKTLGQSLFYSVAHLAGFGVPFRTFAFVQPMVDSNPIAYVEVSEADLGAMLSRIVAMAHDIWRGDTEPKKDDAGCGWCAVRHACEKYRPNSKSVFAPKARNAGKVA